MAALQCEICGGKLIGRPGGIFECDSCGMEYDTAWAKAKIQEIKGTVKVEGTVEVTGTVKVEGAATKEDLVQRGQEALSVEQWSRAKDLFNQALDMAPSYTLANVGLEMAAFHCKDIKTLAIHHANDDIRYFDVTYKDYMRRRLEERTCRKEFDKVKEIAKALGDAWITEYEAIFDEEVARIAAVKEAEEKAAEEARIAEELAEQKRLEEKQRQKEIRDAKMREVLPELRTRASKISNIFSSNLVVIGLKENGTAITTEDYLNGGFEFSGWSDIISVTTGGVLSAGLKANGTVVFTKNALTRKSRISEWRDIVAINTHDNLFGIKADGTVVVNDYDADTYGKYDVENWTNIIDIKSNISFTLGLKADGTVVATGAAFTGACKVEDWSDIVAISAGSAHSLGLKYNGTVVAAGMGQHGNLDVSHWDGIIAISAGGYHSVGLRLDGTVVATGKNEDGQCEVNQWKDIIAISAGDAWTLGLKADGTIVTAGKIVNIKEVSDWKLFDNIDQVIQRYDESITKIRHRAEQRKQWKQNSLCQYCGAPFKKGLFGTRCTKCGTPKDY